MDQSTREEKTLLSMQEGIIDPLKKNESENKHIASMEAESLKDNFLFQKSMVLISFFLILFSLAYIPLGLIIYFKFQIEFKLYGWILIVSICFILLLSTICYQIRFYLIDLDSPAIIVYLIFLLYTVSIIGIISIFALYEIKIAFAIQIEITTGLLLLFTLNNCFCLSKKFIINLIVVYSFVFIGIIFYITFFNRMFLEFFVITIYCSLCFAYMSSLSKYFYEDLYNDPSYDFTDDNLSFRIHLTIMICSHFDILVCTFRD